MEMQTAKVFKSGGSQAIRLPKEFRLDTEEVYLVREGEKIIISPKPLSWDSYFSKPSEVPDDFMKNIEDSLPQERIIF